VLHARGPSRLADSTPTTLEGRGPLSPLRHTHQDQSPFTAKSLEREIGGPLFHRTTRRVSLTAAGRALLVEARACLSAVNRAQQAPRLVIQRQQGALRLGVPITGNPPQLDDAL